MTHADTLVADEASAQQPPIEQMVAELLATALAQGAHLIDGKFFDFAARPIGDGRLVVDLRQVDFMHERDPQLNGVVLQVSIPPASSAEESAVDDESAASAT